MQGIRREKEMKGERCPDTKLFERHLLQLSDNLSDFIPKIKVMSQPRTAHHPPVIRDHPMYLGNRMRTQFLMRSRSVYKDKMLSFAI